MKYTLYAWCADDEGGYGVCRFGTFTPKKGYNPQSGCRAEPSVKIGDFSTTEELAVLIFNDMTEGFDDFYMSDAMQEAEWMMYNFKQNEYDY